MVKTGDMESAKVVGKEKRETSIQQRARTRIRIDMIDETVEALEQLNGVNKLVNVLFQLSECRKEGAIDISATVEARKGVIDNFINELKDTDRKYITDVEDVFYIWLFDKVMKHGNDVLAGKKKEKMIFELERKEENVKRKVVIDGAEASNCSEGIDSKVVGAKKGKNQFSEAIMGYDVEVSKQCFRAALVAFSMRCIPRCGKKFLELKNKVRKRRGENEDAASYYCACGKKNDIYIQFRHDSVNDVVTEGNEKRYRYRCFTKPEKMVVVLKHFDWNCEEFGLENIPAFGHTSLASSKEKSANDTSMSVRVEDLLGRIMFGARAEGEAEAIMREAWINMKERNGNGNRTVTRASSKKRKDEVCTVINATMRNDEKGMVKKSFVIAENCGKVKEVILVGDNSNRKRTRRERCMATNMIHEDDIVQRSVDEVNDNSKPNAAKQKENICHVARVSKKSFERDEVESDSGEDDNDTREAFEKFRIQS